MHGASPTGGSQSTCRGARVQPGRDDLARAEEPLTSNRHPGPELERDPPDSRLAPDPSISVAMSSNGLRSLGVVGIGRVGLQSTKETEAAVFRRILGEAFAIVADAIDTGDAIPADVTSDVDTCRAGVAAGLEAIVLDPIAAACFKSTRRFVALARGRTTEQRAQIGALVVMVQEAVATIAGSETKVRETLTGSAERFERLAHIGTSRRFTRGSSRRSRRSSAWRSSDRRSGSGRSRISAGA